MAKYKKKKSPPTSDPEDSKKKEIPTPEKDEPVESEGEKPTPPTEPTQMETEEDFTNQNLNILFWLRIGLAVMGGIAATFIFEPIEGEERRWASIGFMIAIFMVSIGIAKGINLKLPPSKRKKFFTQGIGSYVFLYLFMWILSYTFLNIPINETGISLPLP